MDLFNSNSIKNILPFDGEVLNCGLVLNTNLLTHYFSNFLEANFWEQDVFRIFGKQLKTNRTALLLVFD